MRWLYLTTGLLCSGHEWVIPPTARRVAIPLTVGLHVVGATLVLTAEFTVRRNGDTETAYTMLLVLAGAPPEEEEEQQQGRRARRTASSGARRGS